MGDKALARRAVAAKLTAIHAEMADVSETEVRQAIAAPDEPVTLGAQTLVITSKGASLRTLPTGPELSLTRTA